MPNNGVMECDFNESQRVQVAQYYKDLVSAQEVGTEVEGALNSTHPKITYTIDGKAVANPLQEVLDIGVCIISGY